MTKRKELETIETTELETNETSEIIHSFEATGKAYIPTLKLEVEKGDKISYTIDEKGNIIIIKVEETK